MSKIDNFPYPNPIPAKIWGVPFGLDPSCWGLQESEMVRVMSREIIFAEFHPKWSRYLNVTDRQIAGRPDGRMDIRTTCLGNTALRYASRGKKRYRTFSSGSCSCLTASIMFCRKRLYKERRQCICSVVQCTADVCHVHWSEQTAVKSLVSTHRPTELTVHNTAGQSGDMNILHLAN